MGSIVKGVFGSPEKEGAKARASAAPPIDAGAFDLTKARQIVESVTEPETKRAQERSRFAQEGRQQLIRDLQAQARGEGPSLAQAQLQAAQDRNLAQQLAAAATQRGGNVALSQRQLAQQAAQTGQQTAQQAAQARIQEAMQARQELGQQLSQEQELSDRLITQYTQLGFSARQAEQQAKADLERLRVQQALGAAGIEQTERASFRQFQTQQEDRLAGFLAPGIDMLTGGGGGGAGGGGGGGGAGGMAAMGSSLFSDKDLKKDIKKSDADVQEFLDKIKSYSFKYKDKEMQGESKDSNYGVLAQDLEKSKAGKSIVQKTPKGRAIDTVKGYGLVLAAQSNLNERLKKLEKRKG